MLGKLVVVFAPVKPEELELTKFFRVIVENVLKNSHNLKGFKSSRHLQEKYENNIGKVFNQNDQSNGVKPDERK